MEEIKRRMDSRSVSFYLFSVPFLEVIRVLILFLVIFNRHADKRITFGGSSIRSAKIKTEKRRKSP